MGIAYRCALKVLRQHGVEPTADDEAIELGGQHDPHAEHELRDWLSKGMDRLPAEQRLVLELAYGGGHSIEEIAAIMQCPEGTVKARMFHARMKLRNLLPELAAAAPVAASGAPR
jgi:RNA polymerase sigma-70 factor (ECF subfamily)